MIASLYRKVKKWSAKYRSLFAITLRCEQALEVLSTKLLTDEQMTRLRYRLHSGKSLNLKDPRSFNEKIAWLKLNNRSSLLTTCSDKLAVRNYIESLGLGSILIRLHAQYDDVQDINFDSLPDKAYLKVTSGSGTNALWNRHRPFDYERFKLRFRAALNHNPYYRTREWNYKHVVPRIIAEHVLEPNHDLVDYKFLCFEGTVKAVFVDIEVAAEDGAHNPGARRNVYNRSFELMPLRVGRRNFPASMIAKPTNYDKMLEIAEKIAAPFPFCRVDLYNINGSIYFGETTFYPSDGMQQFDPPSWDVEFGSWINLKSDKIELGKPESS